MKPIPIEMLPPHIQSQIRSENQKPVPPPIPIHTTTPTKGPNKTEAAYLAILRSRQAAGEITTIYPHESIKFRIGDSRCWYTPDFVAVSMSGNISVHEVKGPHYWDDARVKFQAAKRQYPAFSWVWAQKTREGWVINA